MPFNYRSLFPTTQFFPDQATNQQSCGAGYMAGPTCIPQYSGDKCSGFDDGPTGRSGCIPAIQVSCLCSPGYFGPSCSQSLTANVTSNINGNATFGQTLTFTVTMSNSVQIYSLTFELLLAGAYYYATALTPSGLTASDFTSETSVVTIALTEYFWLIPSVQWSYLIYVEYYSPLTSYNEIVVTSPVFFVSSTFTTAPSLLSITVIGLNATSSYVPTFSRFSDVTFDIVTSVTANVFLACLTPINATFDSALTNPPSPPPRTIGFTCPFPITVLMTAPNSLHIALSDTTATSYGFPSNGTFRIGIIGLPTALPTGFANFVPATTTWAYSALFSLDNSLGNFQWPWSPSQMTTAISTVLSSVTSFAVCDNVRIPFVLPSFVASWSLYQQYYTSFMFALQNSNGVIVSSISVTPYSLFIGAFTHAYAQSIILRFCATVCNLPNGGYTFAVRIVQPVTSLNVIVAQSPAFALVNVALPSIGAVTFQPAANVPTYPSVNPTFYPCSTGILKYSPTTTSFASVSAWLDLKPFIPTSQNFPPLHTIRSPQTILDLSQYNQSITTVPALLNPANLILGASSTLINGVAIGISSSPAALAQCISNPSYSLLNVTNNATAVLGYSSSVALNVSAANFSLSYGLSFVSTIPNMTWGSSINLQWVQWGCMTTASAYIELISSTYGALEYITAPPLNSNTNAFVTATQFYFPFAQAEFYYWQLAAVSDSGLSVLAQSNHFNITAPSPLLSNTTLSPSAQSVGGTVFASFFTDISLPYVSYEYGIANIAASLTVMDANNNALVRIPVTGTYTVISPTQYWISQPPMIGEVLQKYAFLIPNSLAVGSYNVQLTLSTILLSTNVSWTSSTLSLSVLPTLVNSSLSMAYAQPLPFPQHFNVCQPVSASNIIHFISSALSGAFVTFLIPLPQTDIGFSASQVGQYIASTPNVLSVAVNMTFQSSSASSQTIPPTLSTSFSIDVGLLYGAVSQSSTVFALVTEWTLNNQNIVSPAFTVTPFNDGPQIIVTSPSTGALTSSCTNSLSFTLAVTLAPSSAGNVWTNAVYNLALIDQSNNVIRFANQVSPGIISYANVASLLAAGTSYKLRVYYSCNPTYYGDSAFMLYTQSSLVVDSPSSHTFCTYSSGCTVVFRAIAGCTFPPLTQHVTIAIYQSNTITVSNHTSYITLTTSAIAFDDSSHGHYAINISTIAGQINSAIKCIVRVMLTDRPWIYADSVPFIIQIAVAGSVPTQLQLVQTDRCNLSGACFHYDH